MTRDYAKPSTTKTSSKSKPKKKTAKKSAATPKAAPPAPSNSGKSKFFHITLITAILGGFAYGLYKLAQLPADRTLDPTTPTKPSQAKQVEPTKTEKPEARFQFYDMLPNSEVETDAVTAYTFKEKGVQEEYQYMLQTGSFRQRKDAERQKATIAFQGLKASIKATSNDQGSTWFRVQTGPFASRSEMNAALDKLYAINIQPLVKKSKK